jgi:hypothetical protein
MIALDGRGNKHYLTSFLGQCPRNSFFIEENGTFYVRAIGNLPFVFLGYE